MTGKDVSTEKASWDYLRSQIPYTKERLIAFLKKESQLLDPELVKQALEQHFYAVKTRDRITDLVHFRDIGEEPRSLAYDNFGSKKHLHELSFRLATPDELDTQISLMQEDDKGHIKHLQPIGIYYGFLGQRSGTGITEYMMPSASLGELTMKTDVGLWVEIFEKGNHILLPTVVDQDIDRGPLMAVLAKKKQ